MRLTTVRIALIPIVLVILAKCTYVGYLNYRGYCSATGRALSDQEKIDLAVVRLLERYPNGEQLHSFLGYSNEDVKALGLHPIRYRDVHEFWSANRECCRVLSQPNDVNAPPASLEQKLLGQIAAFVEIRYRLRYTDASGRRFEKQMRTTLPISNCGAVVNIS